MSCFEHEGKLKTLLEEVEASGDRFLMDQVMFYLGQLKGHWNHYRYQDLLQNCPQMSLLLPEMKPASKPQLAFLMMSNLMEREDLLGRVINRIIKVEGY